MTIVQIRMFTLGGSVLINPKSVQRGAGERLAFWKGSRDRLIVKQERGQMGHLHKTSPSQGTSSQSPRSLLQAGP